MTRRPGRWLWPVAATSLLVALGANLALGRVGVSVGDVLAIIGDHLGLGDADVSVRDDGVVWAIRAPRALTAIALGAGLAVAGTGLQGVLRNPLAEPYLVGISGGAAVGAASAIAAGASPTSPLVAVVAILAGLGAGWAALWVARFQGRSEVAAVILAGIAVTAAAAAVVGFVSVIARDQGVPNPSFWLLGGLGASNWSLFWMATPFVVVGGLVMAIVAPRLDIALLGADEATHLGVDPRATEAWALGAAALVGGAAVAAAGIVGFVGLVAPHAARSVLGPGHRRLMAGAALLGAAFLAAADLLARITAEPVEVPLGLVTALVGGPAFLLLLRRTRREYGGW